MLFRLSRPAFVLIFELLEKVQAPFLSQWVFLTLLHTQQAGTEGQFGRMSPKGACQKVIMMPGEFTYSATIPKRRPRHSEEEFCNIFVLSSSTLGIGLTLSGIRIAITKDSDTPICITRLLRIIAFAATLQTSFYKAAISSAQNKGLCIRVLLPTLSLTCYTGLDKPPKPVFAKSPTSFGIQLEMDIPKC